MSALNGDKSRFQRLRKAGLRRRQRARLTLAALRARLPGARAGSEGAQAGGAAARPPTPRRSGPSLVKKTGTV
jgi:hypothetical protein